jgi:putative peptidoglycan lipid II flippase
MVCNMGYNIVLVGSTVLLALPAAHTGLALATALSANQQAFMLLRQLGRESAYSLSADNKRIITGAAIATVVMAVVIYLITPDAQFWTVSTASTRVARLVVIIVAAALTYGAALLLLRIHPRDLLPHR